MVLFKFRKRLIAKRGVSALQAAAFSLALALALPASAGEARAIKSKVPPVYPELAKRMKIAGVVKIEATVDADGKVSDVKTLTGSHLLSPAAENAVRKWKFTTGPGTAVVDVDVNFAIPD